MRTADILLGRNAVAGAERHPEPVEDCAEQPAFVRSGRHLHPQHRQDGNAVGRLDGS